MERHRSGLTRHRSSRSVWSDPNLPSNGSFGSSTPYIEATVSHAKNGHHRFDRISGLVSGHELEDWNYVTSLCVNRAAPFANKSRAVRDCRFLRRRGQSLCCTRWSGHHHVPHHQALLASPSMDDRHTWLKFPGKANITASGAGQRDYLFPEFRKVQFPDSWNDKQPPS